jgi:hypothetical protein
VENGWDIEWHFQVPKGITAPLRKALEDAGIRITGVN